MEKSNARAGVLFVGIITLLLALFILFLAYGLDRDGPGNGPPDFTVVEDVLWGFGLLFFVNAVLVLGRLRVGYYLSMASWILLVFGSCYEYYIWGAPLAFFLLCPILYSVFCLWYFSTKDVRIYFSA